MAEIEVNCAPATTGWTCRVRVVEASGEADFTVDVDRPTLERLEPGAADPTELVRQSFAFLLEREPRESILRRFELPVIGRYFPEYESTIRRRLAR